MPEIEAPTEHLHEHIHESAHHDRGNFTMGVALSSAVLAVAAAIAALQAGHAANEAILLQARSTNEWAYFQSKSIKESVLGSKMELLRALDKPIEEKDQRKLEEYAKEKKEIQERATKLSEQSEHEMSIHVALARAVTFFQVAIAACAMAVLSKKRFLWYGGMAMGVVGVVMTAMKLMH